MVKKSTTSPKKTTRTASTKKKTVKKATRRASTRKSAPKKAATDDKVPPTEPVEPEQVVEARGIVATLGDDATAEQVARKQIVERFGIDADQAARIIRDILDEMAAPSVDASKKIGLAQRRLNEVYKMAIQASEPAVALQAARELNRLECLYNKADRLAADGGDLVDPEKEAAREILQGALNLPETDATPIDDLARRLVYEYIAAVRS